MTSAKVDRTPATVGQPVVVTTSVKSTTARTALIDVEIYDRTGRKVFQKYWDNQSFAAGQTRQLSTTWPTSGLTAGPYTVKVGVFGVGWSSFIHWNNNAAAVTLTTSAPTTTTRPPPRPGHHAAADLDDHDLIHDHDLIDDHDLIHDDDGPAVRALRDVAGRCRPPHRRPVRRPCAPGG